MAEEVEKHDATVKIGMVGSAAVGKTSKNITSCLSIFLKYSGLMVKFVENKYDEDYNQTLGILHR
jgi:GTPase SAR1 family protein